MGDIHGNLPHFKKIIELIEKENFNTKNDKIIFLGDYIDRWDWSFEIIELLLKLEKKYNCIFLKGNHEASLLNFLDFRDDRLSFQVFMAEENGGIKTIQSYQRHGYDFYTTNNFPKSHRQFLENLKLFYETEDYIFVHAGIQKDVPLKDQEEDYILWCRYSFIDNNNVSKKKIIFGHTPEYDAINDKFLGPIIKPGKIGIDTGAGFKNGWITSIILPEERFLSTTFLKEG